MGVSDINNWTPFQSQFVQKRDSLINNYVIVTQVFFVEPISFWKSLFLHLVSKHIYDINESVIA